MNKKFESYSQIWSQILLWFNRVRIEDLRRWMSSIFQSLTIDIHCIDSGSIAADHFATTIHRYSLLPKKWDIVFMGMRWKEFCHQYTKLNCFSEFDGKHPAWVLSIKKHDFHRFKRSKNLSWQWFCFKKTKSQKFFGPFEIMKIVFSIEKNLEMFSIEFGEKSEFCLKFLPTLLESVHPWLTRAFRELFKLFLDLF